MTTKLLPAPMTKPSSLIPFSPYRQTAINKHEGIVSRRLLFCPNLATHPTNELIRLCPSCSRFFIICCPHTQAGSRLPNNELCHHFPTLFVSGLSWGGLGAVCGREMEDRVAFGIQWEVPVGGRTTERAELLAAVEGIQWYRDFERGGGGCKAGDKEHSPARELVVVSDSEYVVKGFSEWYPKWKKNKWLTSAKKTPNNLDLFHKLDEVVSEMDLAGTGVGFWKVDSKWNLAYPLAKEGAELSENGAKQSSESVTVDG